MLYMYMYMYMYSVYKFCISTCTVYLYTHVFRLQLNPIETSEMSNRDTSSGPNSIEDYITPSEMRTPL